MEKCPSAHSLTAYYECPYGDKHGNCLTYVCQWHEEAMECVNDAAGEVVLDDDDERLEDDDY